MTFPSPIPQQPTGPTWPQQPSILGLPAGTQFPGLPGIGATPSGMPGAGVGQGLWERLLPAIAQLALSMGKGGGYRGLGFQQAQQQQEQNRLQQQQLALQQRGQNIQYELGKQTRAQQEQGAAQQQQNQEFVRMRGAMDDFLGQLPNIRLDDPAALQELATSVAQAAGLNETSTSNFVRMATARAKIAKEEKRTYHWWVSPDGKSIDQSSHKDWTKFDNYLDASRESQRRTGGTATPTKYQAERVTVNGKARMAIFDPNRGVYLNPTTKEELKDAVPYESAGMYANTAVQGDAKDIADSIEQGLQPPVMTGLYRMGGPVRAELARSGYNLSQAQSEWNSVQRHIVSLNSTQQLRLRQALEKIDPHVDLIRSLYQEWKATGLPGGYKVFNRGALAAARNLPGKGGEVAHNLEAQIVDLTAELSNVYMGGNTPTDQALKLAAHNLSTDWNELTFNRALDLIKANNKMRRNAVRFTGPNGVQTGSPYLPQGPTGLTEPSGQTPPSSSAPATHKYDPKTGKLVPVGNP